MSEHGWRLPRQERTSYPTRWVHGFGLRRFVVFSPKVWRVSLMTTVTLLPFRWSRLSLGVWVGKNEDGEWELLLGGVLFESETQLMRWTS